MTLALPPGRYPHLMPLPPWAADVAKQLLDTDSLVLLEGKLDDVESAPAYDVLVVARLEEIPGVRVELHPLAVILDNDLAEKVKIDPDKTVLYSLSTLE